MSCTCWSKLALNLSKSDRNLSFSRSLSFLIESSLAAMSASYLATSFWSREVDSCQSTQCQDLRCMGCHSWSPTGVKNLITKLICVFREDSSHRGPAFMDLSRSITRPWNVKTDAPLLQLYFL